MGRRLLPNYSSQLVLAGYFALLLVFFLIATPHRVLPTAVRLPADHAAVKDDGTRTVRFSRVFRNLTVPEAYPKQLMEKRFNVEIEPISYDSLGTLLTKLPLLLASGDVPDVIEPGSPDSLRQFAHHGFLMEVPYDLLKQHAPHMVALTNRYAPEKWVSMTYEGRNYGIPFITYEFAIPRTPLWRKDWLEKVGIKKVPETLDEVHEALKRFRYNDPDGNNRRDTYGKSGDLMQTFTTFTEIFGAYGVTPFDWMLKDGKAVWGGIQPESKQALQTLNSWYQEGLIHPDFVTDKWNADIGRKLLDGKIGYHNYQTTYDAFDRSNPDSLVSKMAKLQPDAVLVPGVAPIGPTGKRGIRVWGGGNAPVLAFGAQMAKRPQDVIRILRMMDAPLADEKLYIQTKLGKRGTHWDWNDPTVGVASGMKLLPPYDEDARARTGQGIVQPTGLGIDTPFGPAGGDPQMYAKYLPRSLEEFNRRYRKAEWGLVDLFGRPDAVPQSDRYLSNLLHLQQTSFAQFIKGERPLSEWDQFVAQWKAQGGLTMLDEAQKTLQLQRAILRQTGGSPNSRPSAGS